MPFGIRLSGLIGRVPFARSVSPVNVWDHPCAVPGRAGNSGASGAGRPAGVDHRRQRPDLVGFTRSVRESFAAALRSAEIERTQVRTANVTVGALMILGSALATSALAVAVSTGPPSPGDPISLSDVEEISIGGIGRVTVAIGSPAELTIGGQLDAVEQLVVDVEDGELVIEPEPETGIELADGEELVYEITVERLLDIRLRDDVRLEIDGTGGALGVELSDTTTASLLNVDLEELQAEVQGTAVMRVTGATEDLEVDARESGAFDGTDESARVVVNVATLLEADVGDSAVVEHVGTPAQTDLDVRDSGQVRPATGTLIPAPPVAGSEPVGSPATSSAATPDPGPSTEPAAFEVSLAGRSFNPAVLEVTVGDTVTWINDDDTEHTVTAFEGEFDSGGGHDRT
jgi:Putative auto-transporter adhesin, head GIN domain